MKFEQAEEADDGYIYLLERLTGLQSSAWWYFTWMTAIGPKMS